MKIKLTTTLAAALLAGSVGFAFAGSSGHSANSGSSATATNKMTGCKTLASKEEKGKQGAVANSSSHNATSATTGSAATGGKPDKGC